MFRTIKISEFKASSKGIDFRGVKNPYLKRSKDAYNNADVLIEAICQLSKDGGGTINIDDDYLVNPDGTIVVPNGIVINGQGSIHTDFDGTLFRFDSHMGTQNIELNLYYKLSNKDRAYWIQKGDSEPRNKNSVGVEFRNCRKVNAKINAYAFTKGLYLLGENDGSVENDFDVNLRNCRYGIYADGEKGGWVNGNKFTGVIKVDGLYNRDKSERTESAYIVNNGVDNLFFKMMLEGAYGSAKWLYKGTKPRNYIINCSMEKSLGAGMIDHDTNFGGLSIVDCFGYTPYQIARLGWFHDPEQKIKKRGYVHKHKSVGHYVGNGNMFLGGNQQPEKNDIPTLTINQKHLNSTLVVGQYQTDYKKFAIYADGEAIFAQGKNNYIDLLEHHKKTKMYNLVEYKEGETYGIGDWFSDDLYVQNIFTATTWENDTYFKNKRIRQKPRSVKPIQFKDGKIYAKEFIKI